MNKLFLREIDLSAEFIVPKIYKLFGTARSTRAKFGSIMWKAAIPQASLFFVVEMFILL